MNKWGVRIIGLLLLLLFTLVFAQMHSTLKRLADQHNAAPRSR